MTEQAKPKPERRLTAKQEAYCQLAAVTSYADAYRQVYEPEPGYSIHANIWKLNKNAAIARRIREIQDENFGKLNVTRDWLLQWWFFRMMYDPAEITAWAIGCCRHCHGEGGQYQWRLHEYLDALAEAEAAREPAPDVKGGLDFDASKPPVDDCPNCHGRGVGRTNITDTSQLSPMARAAFEGIKETRQGIEIKMADKDKAAENFAKLSGFDVQQVRMMTDQLPDEATMAQLRADPLAAAAAYKRMLGTTH